MEASLGRVLKKLKIKLPYDPALISIYPKKYNGDI
jgi:hypothetical protein